MITALAWAAAALALLAAAFVAFLAARRVRLARAARRDRVAESALRPLALALADGDEVGTSGLGVRDAELLAGILARYARWLSGDARTAIAAFFGRSGYVEREVHALRARRAWRRATAAFVLGDMASAAALPALLDALHDEERDVRSAAARSLGRLAAPHAVEPLVFALVERRVPRAVAGQALLAIGPAALPRLRDLVDHPEHEVRLSAVELVGLLGNAADAPPLVARLRDTSAEVRAKAARAIGRLGAEDAAAALREALDDRIPFVRVSAATALGLVADADAAPGLLAAARGDTFEVAHAAAWALGRADPEALTAAAAEPSAGAHLAEAADLVALATR